MQVLPTGKLLARTATWFLSAVVGLQSWLVSAPLPAAELHEEIDSLIAARASGPLAEKATDAEFLRRAYLTLGGTIPTTSESRQFLANPAADKRTKLVDQLLEAPTFARRMDETLTVMLLERRAGGLVSPQDWSAYLRASFAANKPWDQLVREIIASDGRDPTTRAAVKFFADTGRENPDQITRDVARLFLGMDLQCAHCHDHPVIKDYKQADYFGLYAYLKQTKPVAHPQTKQAILVEEAMLAKVDFESVFIPGKQATGPRLLAGKEREIPQFEKGQELETPAADGVPGVPKFRPRSLLAGELASKDNPQFIRASVNRFWFLMLGRGIIHPLDLDHSENPPSHPELLSLLGSEFAAHGCNVKWLLREIALSETFARSSLIPASPTDGKAAEILPESYRVAIARPLSPEQLLWSLLQGTGNTQFPEGTAGTAYTVADYLTGRAKLPPASQNDARQLLVAIFGGAPGEAEIDFQPSMGAALFLMNEKLVLDWLQPKEANLVQRLVDLKEPAPIAEELYLSLLTRLPTTEEQTEVAEYLELQKDRRSAALGELAWALLTSAEFRLNH